MNHLSKTHHVRQLLEQAATGSMPSSGQLDKLDGFDLPDGEGLGRFRASINAAAQRIVAQHQRSGYAAARGTAVHECGSLAQRMTQAQLAVTGDPDPEPIDAITARMFGR